MNRLRNRAMRLIFLLTFLSCTTLANSQNTCPGNQPPVSLQIQLALEKAGSSEQSDDDMNTVSKNSAADSSRSGEKSHEFTAGMNIHVELQDSLGTRVGDGMPNGEGRVSFVVCPRGEFRLRVTGATIEEATVDNFSPSRGDRIVSVTLHRKDRTRSSKSAGAISARRLKIPRNAQKELQLGNQALAAGNLAEAQQHFEKAIVAYKDFDLAYNNLGVTLMQKGDRHAGQAAFEKAVSINSHFARALTNLARLALADKDYAKALELMQKSLASEPLNPQALLVGTESAYFSGDYPDAVTFARTLHTLQHSGMGLAHYLSAKSLEKVGRENDAISEYQKFLSEEPNDPNAKRAQMAIIELQASRKPVNN